MPPWTRSSGPSSWWRLVARDVLGRRRTAGLATIAGIAGGCFVHAALSAVGVSLILVRSAEVFHALK